MARHTKVKVLVGIAVVCAMAIPAVAQTTTVPADRGDPNSVAQYDLFPKIADKDVPMPNRAIGALVVGGRDGCTATVVNSAYKSMIVTAEHCFSKLNRHPGTDARAQFAPAANKKTKVIGVTSVLGPYGKYNVVLVQRLPLMNVELFDWPKRGDVTAMNPQPVTIESDRTASPLESDQALLLVCPLNGKRLQEVVGGLGFSSEAKAYVGKGVIGTMPSYPFIANWPIAQVVNAQFRSRDGGVEMGKTGQSRLGASSGSAMLASYAPGSITNHNSIVGTNVFKTPENGTLGTRIGPRFFTAYGYLSKIDPATLPGCQDKPGQILFDPLDDGVTHRFSLDGL